MKQNPLGRTGITVSEICLGSMTWGSQNSEAEGHAQIDYALEHGVDFIDTAEMYPTTPMRAENCGDTEAIIGTWNAKSGKRDQVVIATKVTGAGSKMVRDGGPITGAVIRKSVEKSLARLQTDYIDIYQLHWPNRGSYHFRQSFSFDPSAQDTTRMADDVQDTLSTVKDLISEGKIRHLGLSNETAWGLMQYLNASRDDLPRVVSMQNEYSLLCRLYDHDLAETSHHEDVGLMAWSPLAAGLLSGKYRDDQTPAGSRRAQSPVLNGRMTKASIPAVDAYCALARQHGLDPAQMALAFVLQQPFTMSAIIGATDMAQLATNIAAANITLSDEVLQGITDIHRAYPIPM